MTRILFVGETSEGCSARSLRDALASQPGVILSGVGEDHYLPTYRHLPLRIANRLLRPLQRRELASAVLRALDGFRPDVILVYKGAGVNAALIGRLRRLRAPVVNVFPDYSPHAYGRQLQAAMGCYDLVISTKPFHPRLWKSVYGYRNTCVCVPHGYDPAVHYCAEPPSSHAYDVALCATWRPQYHRLMRSVADLLSEEHVSVVIAGPGWPKRRNEFPVHWESRGVQDGRAYTDLVRSARVAIAPVHREVAIRGVEQPGDEDTIRTYELAAAHCFFVHQRTEYVSTVYDEQLEVPLWTDAADLVNLIRRWLPDDSGRRLMARRAHARAVPRYSAPERAKQVVNLIENLLQERSSFRTITAAPSA